MAFTKSRPNPINAGMAGFSWIAVVPFDSNNKVVSVAGVVSTIPSALLPTAGIGQFFLKQNMGLVETKTLSENRSGGIMGEMTLTLNSQTPLPNETVTDVALLELRKLINRQDVVIFASRKGSEQIVVIGANYGVRSSSVVMNSGTADGDAIGLTATFSTSEPDYCDQYVLNNTATGLLLAQFAPAQ